MNHKTKTYEHMNNKLVTNHRLFYTNFNYSLSWNSIYTRILLNSRIKFLFADDANFNLLMNTNL